MPSTKIWYAEANDGHTEEAIGKELAETSIYEGTFHRDVICQDGKKRDLWEVNYSFITKLLKYAANSHLKFSVFCRDGRHGPVKRWKYLPKRLQTPADAFAAGVLRKGITVPQTG